MSTAAPEAGPALLEQMGGLVPARGRGHWGVPRLLGGGSGEEGQGEVDRVVSTGIWNETP